MILSRHDLNFAVNRLPIALKKLMEDKEWEDRIFVGGGYLRSIVASEKVNDVDCFVRSVQDAEYLALKLAVKKEDIVKTDNAYTIKGKLVIQIIHRWLFEKAEDVSNSFDFTICCAVVYYKDKKWQSFCDDAFYMDLAAKRLIYRNPIRNEDAGGSMLRVLKYYQKGYRIPLDSLANVIGRLVAGVESPVCKLSSVSQFSKVVCGLLREVDPDIDPNHIAHLPSLEEEESAEEIV